MRVLISGGSGFIGRSLLEGLASDYELCAPSHRELDLLDEHTLARYLERQRFEVVIHAATWDASRASVLDQSRVLEANLRMFFNLMAHREAFGKLLYFGSGAEFDKRLPIVHAKEESLAARVPTDPYGLSKLVMSLYARQVEGVTNLRLFGVCGPYEDWRIRFISNACAKAVHRLPITLRQDCLFDYLHIDDLVAITRWFIAHQSRHADYNVCSGQAQSLLAIAEQVAALTPHPVEIQLGAAGRANEYTGDNQRLRAELPALSLRPPHALVESIYSWRHAHRDAISREQLLVDL